MPIMGTCETCGGQTLENCCIVCMSIEIRELREQLAERTLQHKTQLDNAVRLQKFAKTEYQRGLEEGRSCQAILEIQGQERFVEELKADGCPRCPHKEEITRLQQTANNGAQCSSCTSQSAEPVCMYCAACYGEQLAEIERLQGDIQYALDRLSGRVDQGPDLRSLIDEATGRGDYFPASELQRRKDQINEINRHFKSHMEFTEDVIGDVKRVQTVNANLESKCQSLALANDFQCSEIRRLQADYNQRCHDMKQLRQRMGCDGSDLEQLCTAWDKQVAEVERLRREHKEEVDEFNVGWEAASQGEPIENDPSPPQDNWRNGWCARHGDRYHAIVDQVCKVANTGILPDGDGVNVSTGMWLEQLAAEAAEGK